MLAEIEGLIDLDPDDIPPESRYLLELDFNSLYRSSFEQQSYWVRAMKAARRAGRRAAAMQSRRGAAARRSASASRRTRPTINTDAVRAQIREELGLQEPVTRRRTPPSSDSCFGRIEQETAQAGLKSCDSSVQQGEHSLAC